VITKLASRAFFDFEGNGIRYASRVTRGDLLRLGALATAPIIAQAEVSKSIEVRVTIVGCRVFAVAIHSQSTRRTRGDWRRYSEGRYGTPHQRHALPAQVEQNCILLARRLGLRYGAVDLVVTPDGRYVFLEINPNGQWLWLEHLTGIPISDAMSELLADFALRNSDASEHGASA
jgi:glutathione synthase/RimK-type ligase-like ATP-grasp enzyme